MLEGGEGVAEEGDGLVQLAWVGGVGGEGVGEHEGGDGGGGQGGDEGDVAGVRREVVAAAYWGERGSVLVGRLWKGWRWGERSVGTMEPEYHVLGGRITEPVRFRAVWERDIFGGEAALLGKCWICFIEV